MSELIGNPDPVPTTRMERLEQTLSVFPPWLLFLTAVALVTAWWIPILRGPAQLHYIDLFPTYVAGELWQQGESGSVYQPHIFLTEDTADPRWRAMLQKVTEKDRFWRTSFLYSPWYLIMLWPLIQSLSLGSFSVLFLVINAISASWVGWESMRWAGQRSPAVRFAGALLVGALPITGYGAFLGQNIGPMLALLMLGVRLLAPEWPTGSRAEKAAAASWRQLLGGLLFAIATLFKPWTVLVIPLLAFSRRWKALAAATILFIGFEATARSVGPLQIFPAELSADYSEVSKTLPNLTLRTFNNLSIRALLHRLSEPQWGDLANQWSEQERNPRLAWVEALIVGSVGLAAFVPLWFRRRSIESVVAVGLSLVLVPLGICWSHYLILLVPAVWMLSFGRHRPWHKAVGAVGFVLLFAFPIHSLPLGYGLLWPDLTPGLVRIAPMAFAFWLAVPVAIAMLLAFTLLDASVEVPE